jgi:DNA-binding response OmpR family regulator
VDAPLHIAVIEDHRLLHQVTVQLLRDQGHHVTGFFCAEELDDESSVFVPDLYVIDLNLPGEDGLSLARRIRASQPATGIIMVTARDSLEDRLQGYGSGADIYLPKPLDPAELLAALSALSRRLRPALSEACVVDSSIQQLKGPAGSVHLQAYELRLLCGLARAPAQTLEFWQVAQHLGQSEGDFSKGSMEVRVARLRRKLSEVSGAENPIRSLRKTGYRLCVPLLID